MKDKREVAVITIGIALLFCAVTTNASTIHVSSWPHKEPHITEHNGVTDVLFPANGKYQPSTVTISSDDLIKQIDLAYQGHKESFYPNLTTYTIYLMPIKSSIRLSVITSVPVPSAVYLLGSALLGMAVIQRRKDAIFGIC